MSTPAQEGVLHFSKSLKVQVLLDACEMRSLFAALPLFSIVQVSRPLALDEVIVPLEHFLELYAEYIAALKAGQIPEEAPTRHLFSSILTVGLEALYAMPVEGQRYLVKPLLPVVQLQAHSFFYSQLDRKFHPLVRGAESITWGVQFSFPQFAQDPKSGQIERVGRKALNASLFLLLQRWMRVHTRPTPFVVEGIRSNEPMRIGKGCLGWIASHPQLLQKGIAVGGACGR